MEHIKNIEIKNFKSIRHAEIKDCRRVNVFIGYPNVGKSNILEALGLLTFINQNKPSGLKGIVRFSKLTELFNYFNIQEPASIKFNNRFSFLLEYLDEAGIGITLKDDNELESDYTLNVYRNTLKVGLETIHSSYINEVDSFSGRFEVLKNFRIKPYKFFHDKEFNKSFSALELKVPHGENMSEVIINNQGLIDDFSDLLKPYGLTLLIDRSTNDIKITPGIKDGIVYTLPLSLIADTFIRLMFHKTAIYSNHKAVLLFEEPEAHMFPPYISKFTSDIIYGENMSQYFIATHSPYVLNDFMEDLKDDELAIYLVSYKKETGETVIDKMSKEEMHEAYQFGYDFFLNMKNFIPVNKYG
jgi:AAA15 family ATPase/GTPase